MSNYVMQRKNFFLQKSRIRWLHCGDKITSYFHKSNRVRNKVMSIESIDDHRIEGHEAIHKEVVQYFTNVLGTTQSVDSRGIHRFLFVNVDVREAMFSIHSQKAPGLDRYSVSFFKHNWEVVGPLITDAVLSFFRTSSLLKVWNNTYIFLIPKVAVR